MTTPRPSPSRHWLGAAAGATVLATCIAVATGQPAAAEPIEIDDAVLEWGISEEVGAKAPPAGGCNFLSAGTSDGNQHAYKATDGNVTIARLDGATPTWATRCAGVGSPFQKVVWAGGTGTADPTTGTVSISFTGKLTINFYGGLLPFTIEDPVLTISAGGTGTLVATMFGWESDMANPFDKTPVTPVDGVVVADLSGVSVGSSGFTTTPGYAGVHYTPPAGSGGTPQNRTNPGWGSWPASFVDFHYLTGLTSYWYSSGGAADPYKAPSAIAVAWGEGAGNGNGSGGNGGGGHGGEGGPIPTPGEGEQVVSVVVPQSGGAGEFGWAIEGDGVVSLGNAADYGTFLYATGSIDPITVVDTRAGGPEWSISGQVGDFGGGLPGSYLGWSPQILQAGAGALPGNQVPSGFGGGIGLSSPSLLAAGQAGHPSGTARLGAALDLRLPIETAPGTYSAVLTITALS